MNTEIVNWDIINHNKLTPRAKILYFQLIRFTEESHFEEITPTNKDLSEIAKVSKETISRLLKELKENNIIKTSRRDIFDKYGYLLKWERVIKFKLDFLRG
jgi:DNA-binding transcriptional ArsR family regulator